MRRLAALALCNMLALFASISSVNAADESFADQFIGSPLLVLLAIIVIDIIALLYHKIRK